MIGDWEIIFEFNNTPRRVRTPLEQRWNFDDLKQGFWVTPELKLCAESQGRYWIPPSRILYIENVGA
jgi:hypothetical protein